MARPTKAAAQTPFETAVLTKLDDIISRLQDLEIVSIELERFLKDQKKKRA